MENHSVISIKEFVQRLVAGGGITPLPADCVAYGYESGWLELQDMLEQGQPLQRKIAARIIHEFLRRELKETDEMDSSPAYYLQDLFDCRVCAGHIIQVYVKGIMDERKTADGKWIFDAERVILKEEAEELYLRIFCEKQRMPKRVSKKNPLSEPSRISPEEAMQKSKNEKDFFLVDVRTEREFGEEKMEGAVNIPLLQILKNPYAISGNRDKMILLYCREGYQSKAAACCLLEAGYEHVAYFAWNALS